MVKAVFLITLFFLFGFIFFVGIIIFLVLNRQKKGKGWVIVSLISFSICAILGFQIFIKSAKKAKQLSKEARDMVTATGKEILTDEKNRDSSIIVNQLKGFEKEGAKVPSSFYTYFGFRDWYRYPLVYPYAIHCVDRPKNGNLYSEYFVDNHESNIGQSIRLNIDNIQKFAFDKNLLLLENLESDSLKYSVFQFHLDKKENFNSFDEMMIQAKKQGYQGPDTLITIRAYNNLF